MVGSASSVISEGLYGTPWSIFVREVIWMAVGTGVFLAMAKFDYRSWRRWSKPLLGITFLALAAVLVPGVGNASHGSSRWIGFGPLKVQPSEMMKLALAVYGADFLARMLAGRFPVKRMFTPLMLVTVVAVVLVLKQPDLGTSTVLMLIALALLFAAGIPRKWIAASLAAVAGVALLVAAATPYMRARLTGFINPGSNATGTGYQVNQSLIGLGSGHFFGLGLGGSHEKWGLLPNAHTDFIFSVIGEELGIVGALVVLALVAAFALKGLRIASEATDDYGQLLAVAIVVWITMEAVINIGAVVGFLPVTGIPLPFISFGGSSLVITMAAAGILVSISRHQGTREGRVRQTKATTKQAAAKRAVAKPSGAAARLKTPSGRSTLSASRPRASALGPTSNRATSPARRASPSTRPRRPR